ncbi:MAG TPA: hypothetical protein VH475_29700 [Tepidisphaeraceae bacterium]
MKVMFAVLAGVLLAAGTPSLASAQAADTGTVKAQDTVTTGQEKMAGKTMSASGTVKSVAADSIVVTDKDGKDWTFAVDSHTKVIAKGASHMSAEKKASGEPVTIADAVKEGEKVSVKYHDMEGKMHAASVRVQ